jgi:hypothetical protein
MEDGLAKPATEFFRQDYESQPFPSFSGTASSFGIYRRGDTLRFVGTPAIPVKGLISPWRTLADGQWMNYAVRFRLLDLMGPAGLIVQALLASLAQSWDFCLHLDATRCAPRLLLET